MFDFVRARLMPFLKLPAEPQPPAGAPGSVRVFRAGRNFYRLTLLRWTAGQLAAAAGIIISIGFLWKLESDIVTLLTEIPAPAEIAPAEGAALAPADPDPAAGVNGSVVEELKRRDLAGRVAPHARWVIPLLNVLEAFGILSFFVQLVVTLIVLRLEYEMRWYMVTDRSLRIRSGVWKVQETTMSFANLQQVELSQGPLQRLLGIADVRVQSAGGGGGSTDKNHQEESLHTGVFHGVTNASEIRNLIQARLRNFREAGLGDPDDAATGPAIHGMGANTREDVWTAVHELLTEARALRAMAGRRA